MNCYVEALLRLIYPATCGVCQALLELEEKGICQACRQKLEGLRYRIEDTPFNPGLPWLDQGWALFPYEDPVKEILSGIKFMRKRWLMRLFKDSVHSLSQAIANENQYDYLIPIPLDRQKLVDRQFNQSGLLAGLIEEETGISARKTFLTKRFPTAAQSRLSRQERCLNLRQVFKIHRKNEILGRTFLLVDDIFTTGATCEEAARMLKSCGAKQVDTFVLARTHMNSSRN